MIIEYYESISHSQPSLLFYTCNVTLFIRGLEMCGPVLCDSFLLEL